MANLDWNTVMLLLIALMNFAGIVIGVFDRKKQTQKLEVIQAQTDGLTKALVKAEADKGDAKVAAIIAVHEAVPVGPMEVSIEKSVPLEIKK